MNPLTLDPTVGPSAPLTDDQRIAIQQRLAQIEVAIGHPSWTTEQLAAFVRERTALQRALAIDDSQQGPRHAPTAKPSIGGSQN